MRDGDDGGREPQEDNTVLGYEPPEVRVIGALADLTKGTIGNQLPDERDAISF